MKARDLAWLAAMVEDCKTPYARKQQVVDAIQRAWKAANTVKMPSIFIPVTTSWAEEQAKKQAEENDQKGRKKE